MCLLTQILTAVRLNSIKLSGFKSFAEPTNFVLPGQLVGVVGPNGCGKSNIMDACRWVLGESKASELRGESMQDVIFNGTNTRKAASRASVELVFDNADHRAGGQWGQFAEIAVKRVLTRDGNSSYYINNQPVRRRDVQDVFLGTGLGPRAYAIIGQGTISRIIESRPEELRLFLEEAAGVSKYKERRRETENRLSDTRENLTRVEDILRELNANLEKLEKQAEVAQRFNNLKADATLKQQQLWFFKRADAESDQVKIKADVDKVLAWAKPLLPKGPILIYATTDAETLQKVQTKFGREKAGEWMESALAQVSVGLQSLGVKQWVIAGGETSGACVQALNISQMQIGAQIDPGVPWCYAPSHDAGHLSLKSGNFGTPDFFTKAFQVLTGASA